MGVSGVKPIGSDSLTKTYGTKNYGKSITDKNTTGQKVTDDRT